ncbi:MAG: hypothetical protein ACREDK_07485 [Thermoplasmata archaeon]
MTVAALEEESPTHVSASSRGVAVWESRFEHRLEEWDRHLAACRICLVHGTTLCFEGEHLSDLVGEAREHLAVERVQAARAEVAAHRTVLT